MCVVRGEFGKFISGTSSGSERLGSVTGRDGAQARSVKPLGDRKNLPNEARNHAKSTT